MKIINFLLILLLASTIFWTPCHANSYSGSWHSNLASLWNNEILQSGVLIVVQTGALVALSTGLTVFLQQFFIPFLQEYTAKKNALKESSENNSNPTYHNGNTALHIACYAKDIDKAQCLINEGADINIQNVKGDTPLHIALQKYASKIASILISHDTANLDLVNNKGEAALHIACKKQLPEVVQLLIDKKADLNIQNKHYAPPLYIALCKKDATIAKMLITGGADINLADKNNFLLIDCAQDIEMAKILIDCDPNITLRTALGQTLLHKACQENSLEVVKVLLEKITTQSSLNKSSCVNAQDHNGYTPAHLAIWGGNSNIIKELLAHGADITLKDNKGLTSLYYACQNKKAEIVKLLLQQQKINLNEPTKDTSYAQYRIPNTTYLNLACNNGSLEIVQLLIDHDADITLTNNRQETALHCACNSGHLELVKYLLKNGANLNVKNFTGCTPLYAACENNQPVIVEYLISQEANITTTNDTLYTPLDSACYQGHLAVVKILIENGASLAASDSTWGNTPLHFACYESRFDIIQYLTEKGADITVMNMDNQTPYDILKEKTLKIACNKLRMAFSNKNVNRHIFFSLEAFQKIAAGKINDTQSPDAKLPLDIINIIKKNYVDVLLQRPEAHIWEPTIKAMNICEHKSPEDCAMFNDALHTKRNTILESTEGKYSRNDLYKRNQLICSCTNPRLYLGRAAYVFSKREKINLGLLSDEKLQLKQ